MGKVTSTLTLCGFLAVIVIPAYFFKWSYVVGNAASEPPRAEEQAARADLAKRLPRAEPHVVAAPRVEAPRVVVVANTPLARCSSADTVQTLHKVLDQYFGAASGGGILEMVIREKTDIDENTKEQKIADMKKMFGYTLDADTVAVDADYPDIKTICSANLSTPLAGMTRVIYTVQPSAGGRNLIGLVRNP